MGMWNCGKPPAQSKTKHPCAKPKYHPAALGSALGPFMEGTDAPFCQTKGVFPFHTIAWKGSLQKDEGEKKDRASLIKENIWHAESVNKTLFKAIRLSSHRLFKIRKNAGNYLFSSLMWNSFVCILGWRAEGKGEESIFLLLVAMILSKWHDLKESFMACPLQSKRACQLWDNQIWSHFYIT